MSRLCSLLAFITAIAMAAPNALGADLYWFGDYTPDSVTYRWDSDQWGVEVPPPSPWPTNWTADEDPSAVDNLGNPLAVSV